MLVTTVPCSSQLYRAPCHNCTMLVTTVPCSSQLYHAPHNCTVLSSQLYHACHNCTVLFTTVPFSRHNCTMLVAVFDSLIQPCPRDFKSYLEVRYECVRGITDRRRCRITSCSSSSSSSSSRSSSSSSSSSNRCCRSRPRVVGNMVLGVYCNVLLCVQCCSILL